MRQGGKKVLDEGNDDAFGFGRKAQVPRRLFRFHSKDMLDGSGGFVKPIVQNSNVSHRLIS